MRDSSYDYIPLIGGGGGGSRSIRAAASDTALDHNVIDELFRFRGPRSPWFNTSWSLQPQQLPNPAIFDTLFNYAKNAPRGKKKKKKKNSVFHPAEAVRPLDVR